MGHKARGPRAVGILPPKCLVLGLGNEARERERERERGSERMGFHSPLEPMDEMWASVWMSVQQGKWRVPPRAHLFLGKVQGRGPPEGDS